ncbi:hypothetical protein V8C35DRAFT_303920 [Trichoderma chlorosporum]
MAGATHKIAGSTDGVRRPGWHSESMSCIRHGFCRGFAPDGPWRGRVGCRHWPAQGRLGFPWLETQPSWATPLSSGVCMFREQRAAFVKEETSPGEMRNQRERHAAESCLIRTVVLLLWATDARLARALDRLISYFICLVAHPKKSVLFQPALTHRRLGFSN